MKHRRIAIIAGVSISIVFGLYLTMLFRSLDASFQEVQEFIPTRIYSDVSRVAVGQVRRVIEERLKSLGYSVRPESGESIEVRLHPMIYPVSLVPEGHAQSALDRSKEYPLKFHFAGSGAEAQVDSIELNGAQAADVYLEPELVATLSRGPSDASSRTIREVLKFEDVPPSIWKAIIAIEDQHFLSHAGLDPRGLFRALWVNLTHLSLKQGGSTITQQLVKNLLARRDKNIFRKVNEVFLSILLELRYSKEQILERYLNEVYLGQVGNLEIHGVAEGAKYFFGKRIDELNLAETALIAGLIRGPGFYSPYRYRDRAVERQRLVLKKMVETGQIAQPEADRATKVKLTFAPPQSISNKAPYFVDYVKADLLHALSDQMSELEVLSAGYKVYTTLDVRLNQSAQKSVQEFLKEKEYEGALASVDHATGRIRALVGGKDFTRSTFNRILNMKRQVGSTFKPLVFLSAIIERQDPNGVPYGPAYPLEDSEWTLKYDQGRQEWSPQNYEKEYLGWVPMRDALALSINTATARLGVRVGLQSIIDLAYRMGVDTELPKVPSISLGVADLSPIELVRVYSTIANRGVNRELYAIRLVVDENNQEIAHFLPKEEAVVDALSIDLLIDMMKSVFSKGTARTASQLGWDRPSAGKTGTTSQHRDAWFAGFSPSLTTVVWVGEDVQAAPTPTPTPPPKGKRAKPEIKEKLTGATAALPIWARFMKEAHRGEPVRDFDASGDLTELKIDKHTGKIATSDCPSAQVIVDRYLKESESTQRSCEVLDQPTEPETVIDEL